MAFSKRNSMKIALVLDEETRRNKRIRRFWVHIGPDSPGGRPSSSTAFHSSFSHGHALTINDLFSRLRIKVSKIAADAEPMDSSSGTAGDDKTIEKDNNEHRTMRPKLKYSLSYCPSMSRPLDFSVKGPVPIYIHKKQKVLTGCSYIELKLQKHSKVGEITFRNYYTASVSVLLLRSNAQGPAVVGSRNWEVGIKNRILMKQPHCENGAQDYFSLFSTEVWNNVSKLKIILRQPSPMCKTFHLEEIKLYADVPRFGRPFFEQKLPLYLVHNTTAAITWKPNSRTSEMSSTHRSDKNRNAQCGYVVEQVPSNYDGSKIM